MQNKHKWEHEDPKLWRLFSSHQFPYMSQFISSSLTSRQNLWPIFSPVPVSMTTYSTVLWSWPLQVPSSSAFVIRADYWIFSFFIKKSLDQTVFFFIFFLWKCHLRTVRALLILWRSISSGLQRFTTRLRDLRLATRNKFSCVLSFFGLLEKQSTSHPSDTEPLPTIPVLTVKMK